MNGMERFFDEGHQTIIIATNKLVCFHQIVVIELQNVCPLDNLQSQNFPSMDQYRRSKGLHFL